MNIFIGEQAENLLNEIEKNVIPFMSEVGGVFYKNGWWVGYKVKDNYFDAEQFLDEKDALNFVKK